MSNTGDREIDVIAKAAKVIAIVQLTFNRRHSYSIYLWHAVAALWLARFSARWFGFSVYAAAAIFMGVTTWKSVEFPEWGLREKFFPLIRQGAAKPQQPTREMASPTPTLIGGGAA